MGNQTINQIKNDLKENHCLSTTKYRQWYQQHKVSRKHSPWLHPLFNFSVLLLTAAVAIMMTVQAGALTMETLLLFPLTLVLGNLVVFLLHRYTLHRRYKFFPFPYDEHTILAPPLF